MIRKYHYKNKTYYLIQLSYTDQSGKRHQPKYRKDRKGQRISSERTARLLEFEYLNEFIAKLEGKLHNITFSDWHKKFIETIKLSYKKSTVSMYQGDLLKWLPGDFMDTRLDEINKTDIHKLIFETLPENNASPNIQKKTRRVLHKIFETALEEGLIDRNPAKGIKVKVPPAEKLVLNHDEVLKLLTEARKHNHHFFYHWCVV